jgi:hypothetical protein
MAQVPQAFKYQAVVRDHNGSVIADQNINLRISILSESPTGEVVYTETHPATTNGMGLVNIEIGQGFNPAGSISGINWGAGNFYVKIEMDDNGGGDFEAMGVTRLLSVPYALHAVTAEGISGFEDGGVPANNWILFGNSNTNPEEDKLGTTDPADLVIVTDNTERMRVLSGGDINIINSANIGKNLTVEQNVNLNTFSGETNNYGPFTVANLSPTLLSGTLTVDLHTDLNSSLNVDGITDLNSAFNVNNGSPSLLTGTLLVNEDATFNQHVRLDNPDINAFSPSIGALVVDGGVGIGRDLYVGGNAFFDGPLAVRDETESTDIYTGALTVAGGVGIQKRLNVGGATMIENTLGVNGQMTVHANPGGHDQDTYADYPLLVEGGNQGIAIKVEGTRSASNNFISFWDNEGSGKMHGRIEGQTTDDLWDDPEFLVEFGIRTTDVIINGVEAIVAVLEWTQGGIDLAAAASSSTACAGLGACVTAPIPSLIGSKTINFVLKVANIAVYASNLGIAIAEEAAFLTFKHLNIGVSYQSGAGDYAEWLPKLNPSHEFRAGELVGISNGFVTKNIINAEKIMVVSTRPAVLGNMPQQGLESNYVKIAFMGQVPVQVLGDVKPGDYILPVDLSEGYARAVHPEDMKSSDYRRIAGVAWNVMETIAPGASLVNVAVGLNTNNMSDLVYRQEQEIAALQDEYTKLNDQFIQTNAILSELVPGFAEAAGLDPDDIHIHDNSGNINDENQHPEDNLAYSDGDDILYFEISREQVESAIDAARETYVQILEDKEKIAELFIDEETRELLNSKDYLLLPIEEHPFWNRIDSDPQYREEIIQYVQETMQKAIHTHKKHAHKFTDIKLHE